jgi:hypothetical protein
MFTFWFQWTPLPPPPPPPLLILPPLLPMALWSISWPLSHLFSSSSISYVLPLRASLDAIYTSLSNHNKMADYCASCVLSSNNITLTPCVWMSFHTGRPVYFWVSTVFALSCVGRGLAIGQPVVYGVLPNVYNQHIGAYRLLIWSFHSDWRQ